MKSIGLILLGILGGAAPILYGQDAAQPSVDLYEGAKQPNITPTPIPELNGPNLPELPQLDEAFKPKSLGKEVDERRIHIQWRQLKNRVENDPQVRAAKASAQAARTDLERRNRFHNYYDVYYARMSALASSPELKVALEAQKSAHVSSLAQPNVRPSPSASPTPDRSKVAAPSLPKKTEQPSPSASPTPDT
jgi:hypothetical protein